MRSTSSYRVMTADRVAQARMAIGSCAGESEVQIVLYRILREGVRRSSSDEAGITPGGVLAYGDEWKEVATVPFGRSHFGSADAVFDVTAETVYDLASLTKPLVTAAILMKLDVDLKAPVGPLVPELSEPAANITWQQLLSHKSGLPAHARFYERLLAGDRAGAPSRREALLRMAASAVLAAKPGTKTCYSDLGYIVLGFAIERLCGERLDRLFTRLVAEPLGMNSARFIDLDAEPDAAGDGSVDDGADGADGALSRAHAAAREARIAPTEVCPYRGLVWGEVHDDNAHAGGGIFGHAGVFATVGDVSRFACAMVSAAAGQEVAGFEPKTVRRFFTTRSKSDHTWRLGWQTPSLEPGASHAGSMWPADGVGHLGFTGTSIWLDPSNGRYVVLLTNRVHPSRDKSGIKEFRRVVMDAVVYRLDQRRLSRSRD
ncbi:MAG: serine hydrolase domain-containing protein [Haliangiales bacterium]